MILIRGFTYILTAETKAHLKINQVRFLIVMRKMKNGELKGLLSNIMFLMNNSFAFMLRSGVFLKVFVVP